MYLYFVFNIWSLACHYFVCQKCRIAKTTQKAKPFEFHALLYWGPIVHQLFQSMYLILYSKLLPAETHLFGLCYASRDWVAPRGVTENVQKVQSRAIGFYAEATSASVGLLPCWWADTRSPLAPSFFHTATIFPGIILSRCDRVPNKMWHLGGQIMKLVCWKAILWALQYQMKKENNIKLRDFSGKIFSFLADL